MNSIDMRDLREITDPLFDALLREGRPDPAFFPLAPDPRLASYYTERAQPAMTPADFRAGSFGDADGFASCLQAHCAALGRPQAAGQAALIADTAGALHALYRRVQPEAELSPYIYQMF